MAPLVAALLANGPSMLRLAGNLFGGKTHAIANGVAGLLDAIKDQPADKQAAALESHLKQLSVEDIEKLNQVKIRIEEINMEREKNTQLHQQRLHAETEATARAEQQYGTDYVKETRPKIARGSFIAGTLYVLTAEAARLLIEAFGGQADGASWELAAMLYGPCGAYIGFRSWDKRNPFSR